MSVSQMPRKPIHKADARAQHLRVVRSGLSDILQCRQSTLRLAELHDSVASLLDAGAPALSGALAELTGAHFAHWTAQLQQSHGAQLLSLIARVYSDFLVIFRIVPKVYMQFDARTASAGARSGAVLRACFFRAVLCARQPLSDAIGFVRRAVHCARQSAGAGSDLQRAAVLSDMLYSFRAETDLFASLMQSLEQDTRRYYDSFFAAQYDGGNFAEYLRGARAQFAREEEIARAVLSGTAEDLLRICVCALFGDNIGRITEGFEAVGSVFAARDAEPMAWMVGALERFGFSAEMVFGCCAEFVKAEMLKLGKNFDEQCRAAVVARNVGELMDLAENLYSVYAEIFRNNREAMAAVENSIRAAWNAPRFSIPENFCIYIDQNVRNEMKNLSNEGKDDFVKKVALFYRRTVDKKMFSEIYNSYLTVRITRMREKLVAIESPVIQAIRRENSPDFAKIFRELIQKIHSSQELVNGFFAQKGKDSKIQFAPLVFDQRGFPMEMLEVPSDISPKFRELHNKFYDYYTNLKQNSKLTMLFNLSTVDALLIIPKNQRVNQRTYSITTDVYCASILNLISQGEKKFKDLLLSFNDRRLLSLYLKQLCSPSQPILKRVAFIKTDKVLNEEDIFIINPNFVHNSPKITVQSITNRSQGNLEAVTKKVEFSKKQSIKASIIRFLKKTRRIEQSKLEQNVIVDLSQYFHAELSLIRSTMSELEEDSYFKREKTDGKEFLIFLDAGF